MKREIKLPANIQFNKEDAAAFLISEYEQCFEHMRHYDGIEISFIKFALTGYVALGSAMFALFKYMEGATYRDIVIGGILLSALCVGLVILTLMLRNRVYFVVVARQVNSLRNYFLNNMERDFIKYNKCYIDPYFPRAFSPFSTYTLLFTIVALLNGALGGLGSYLVITYAKAAEGGVSWVIGLVIAIALVLAQLVAAFCYLRKHDRVEPTSETIREESAEDTGGGRA